MPRSLPILPAEVRVATVSAARSLLTAGPKGQAVEFRHQGRSLRGLDCIGMCHYAITQGAGVEVEDVRGYPRIPDGVTLRAGLVERLGPPISMYDAQAGDLVLMAWTEDRRQGIRYFNHVGMLTPAKYSHGETTHPLAKFCLIHSLLENQRVCESRMDNQWLSRSREVFSLTGAP